MNVDAGSIVVAALLAFGVWGLIPRRRSADSQKAPVQQPPPVAADDAELTRKVGVVTGLMGGSVEDAAVTKYALSRLEKPPTAYDIGVAAAAQSETRRE